MKDVLSPTAIRRASPDRTWWRGPGLLLRLIAAATPWALIGFLTLHAQDSKPSEYQVKAAYLYNFGKFVEWPSKVTAAGGGSFTICVLGQDPFGESLNAVVAGETIEGKSVVIKRAARPQEAVNCRILFISSSEENQLREILQALEQTSVLTVSDMPQFSKRGGMVQFVWEGKRVRFEVNLTTAERAGLTLSSQLLKLAVAVRRSSQPGD